MQTYFWTEEPALVGPLTEAVEALAEATGRRDVRVDPRGVSVVFADDMFNEGRGDFDCAQTELRVVHGNVLAFAIRVDETPAELCMPLVGQLLHEVIHALAPRAEHTESGVFSDRGSADGVVDAESLDRLCDSFRCAASHRPEPVGSGPE